MNTEHNLTKRDQNAPENVQQRPAVAPAVDIYENAEELLVVADLPGVGREDLTVHLVKGELTLEGRRRDAAESNGATDRLPDYRRTFLVPQGVDSEKISADLQAGILRVHLPKRASLKPRQIPIATG